MRGPFLAIDWGTTNRRIYRVSANGAITHTECDDRGILSPAIVSFDGEVAAIQARFGDLPMLCAGMIGSNRGWHEVPYVTAPAGFDALAAGICWIDPGRIAIVPGVRSQVDGRADVMRGEEVQLLGAVAAGLAPADALLCQPGTHAKWARMVDGRIADFTTAMTGEVFALLRTHGILAGQLGSAVADGPAFRAGVAAAGRSDLLADLFEIRAATVLGTREAEDSASYLSGLLIGTDVAARVRQDAASVVHVLADEALGALYVAAIELRGNIAIRIDSRAAFLAGITHLWSLLA